MKIYQEVPLSLRVLGFSIATVVGGGCVVAASVFIATSFAHGYFWHPLCLRNECVSNYSHNMSQVFATLGGTLALAVAISTIGGIFVALLSYLDTSNKSAFTNHINHLKIFIDYLDSEIMKRDRLSVDRFDALLLYTTIFDRSRDGITSASDRYKLITVDLNKIIESSNKIAGPQASGGFDYNGHQRMVRDVLSKIGIKIDILLRNDYMLMEDQLFSLLQRVNQSFCAPGEIPAIEERRYS